MTLLVFALGLLFMLVGAVAIMFGAPVIQLERGWAEVISGSVAMAGGSVTCALGVVLLRLQALQHTLARSAVAAVSVDVEPAPAVVSDVIEAELRPSVDPEEGDIRSENSVSPAGEVAPVPAAETRHGLWKRVRRPATQSSDAVEDRADPTMLSPRDIVAPELSITETAETAPAVIVTETTFTETIRTETVVLIDEPDEPAPVAIARGDLDLAPERPVDAPVRSSLSERWLRARTPRSASAPEAAPEPPLVLQDEPPLPERVSSDDLFPIEPAPPSPGRAARSAPLRLEPEPEVLPEPTVVGRYQAGVASYVMYSDGTIHVETEGGDVHRFGSMDELKAFIARQDLAPS